MKTILFTFTVVVASVAARSLNQSTACTPRSVFYDNCNRCVCNADGTEASCTRRACPPGVYNRAGSLKEESDVIVVDKAPEQCEVGRRYQVDCNRCICSENRELACTRKLCVHSEARRKSVGEQELPALPEGRCEPGKQYKNDCNVCLCGKQGVPVCTLQICFENSPLRHPQTSSDIEKWGPVYNHGDPCKAGNSFYSECNECVCGRNGKSAVCTLKTCMALTE